MLLLSMAIYYCLFPQHCLSIDHLAPGPSPSLAVLCHALSNSESFFLAGEQIVSAEKRLCLQFLVCFWSLLLVLFNAFSDYSTSWNTERLQKYPKQYMIILAALYCWTEQRPICTWHRSQEILLKLEKRDLSSSLWKIFVDSSEC